MDQIDRREALRRLSFLVGGTLSSSTVGAVLSGCGGGSGSYEFQTLTPYQHRLVASIAETIIPTTDTPGATGAGVDQFIDLLLTDWMRPDEKGRFMEGLMTFGSSFSDAHGTDFAKADEAQRLEFMTPLDQEAAKARKVGIDPLPFFAMMKELTVVGYYTSEIGAARELRYQIVFDKYDGDVDWHEGDRAFSQH